MKKYSGLTLIELIITISIFLIAILGILGLFIYSFKVVGGSKARLAAVGLASKQIEIIRNMPYYEIGTTEGWPDGEIPSSQTINQNGINYTVKIVVDYVDNPFDGLFPDDTTGSDYKKAEVKVSWDKFPCQAPVKLTTNISPKGLEIANNTGGLSINVINRNGLPVAQAVVHIENSDTDPNINITRETANNGMIKILDLPPSIENYHITIGKEKYSMDYTLPSGIIENPNPIQPDLTVIVGELTGKTFIIDKISKLNVSILTKYCSHIPNISFGIQGKKLIGRDPDVYKYSQILNTGASGEILIDALEFDTYTFSISAPSYDLAGTKPLSPLIVLPDTEQNFYFILSPHQNNTLLVTVKDNSSGLVLSDANVKLSKTGYEKTLITGKGIWRQTDWHGGNGQEDWLEEDKYFIDDTNVNISDPGEIKLADGPTSQNFNETFDNTTYKNAAATTADWNTGLGELKLAKTNGDFASSGTGQSLKINSTSYTIVKAYLSANQTLNGQTINYYLSADGGINWENVIPGIEHDFVNQGNDLRWKAELFTTDFSITPSIQSLSISCTDLNPFTESAYLVSSSFDTGTNKTIWGNLGFEPQNQAPELGESPIKLQIATNNDNTVWNFLGPDATDQTYYTVSNTVINSIHNNQQYIRYKIFLSTENTAFTPIISDITYNFTSGCSTPGQVFFTPLEQTDYNLEITLEGYQTFTQIINISGNNFTEIYLDPIP